MVLHRPVEPAGLHRTWRTFIAFSSLEFRLAFLTALAITVAVTAQMLCHTAQLATKRNAIYDGKRF